MAGTPMLADVELMAVQWIRQEIDQGFVRQRIAGLDGTLHQKLGRRSHRVVLSGLLVGETAADDLKILQDKAAAGEEISFTADITTALEVDKMVIESLAAEQVVGRDGQFSYTIALAESPPLPPPAEVGAFGGLDEFGFGDLGFDTGALDDLVSGIADQASALTGAVDAALDAANQLQALASLGDLGDLGNPLKPLSDKVSELGGIGTALSGIGGQLGDLIG